MLLAVALSVGAGLSSSAVAAPSETPKALYDAALKADLSGDALASQELLLTLASRYSDSRYGQAARRRIGGGLGAAAPAVVGVLAAVAIPAFVKYTKRSKTVEASMNLRRLFDGQVSHFSAERANTSGEILPNQFATTTKPAPAQVPCGVAVAPRGFDQPGFKALNFAPQDPIRFQYQVISEGVGTDARFTVRAVGDLDCDGVLSTFERVGHVDPDGNVNGGAGIFKENPLE
jgi:type II secretory pathway pseudopilin PulG